MKPSVKPARPEFSSGPCAKRPGWTVAVLGEACVGRSHRSTQSKRRLADAITRTKSLLGMPDDYRLGIVPASDTGAVEMALWNLLGARGVDVLVWESFSKGWATDVTAHLKLDDTRVLQAPYGELPDLQQVDFARDVVFAFNGTTSGVRVPSGDWIRGDRAGLTIGDATSAAFAMDLPWDKLDVTTWSWQKCLGGEAAHGMIALSPRAVHRLQEHTPSWPIPKILRLTKNGALDEGLFEGSTINTPSMLCVEDWLDALTWAESIGGLAELIARSRRNLGALEDWIRESTDFDFLAAVPSLRSSTSICMKIVADEFVALCESEQRARIGRMTRRLAEEQVAYDIAGYRDAPPGLRVWGGPTVDTDDLRRLVPWLEWAYAESAQA